MVEGAGSPAEINLREGDIANMGFAEAVDCPVIIVADIDKGGVFAQLVGTLELLSQTEQNRVVGFVINKFRGDIALLQDGLDWLEARTNKPVLGVLPYLMDLQLAEEDAIQANQKINQDDLRLRIVVPVFSRISNHTDFDMLRIHPQIELTFVRQGQPLPPADLIILPGSKNVRSDLALLKQHGWHNDIAKHLRYNGKLLGICGGYQMLGQTIDDPQGVEGTPGVSQGLGYLAINTVLQAQKQLTQNQGQLLLNSHSNQHTSVPIKGYQIHVGTSAATDNSQAFCQLENGQKEGCVSHDNQVAGSYLHGMFDSPQALQQIMAWAGAKIEEIQTYHQQQEQELNRLADACTAHLDWSKITPLIRSQLSD
jgi:adenosylcobyric acid synthase